MQPSPEVTSMALSVIGWIRFALEAGGAMTIAAGAIAAVVEPIRSISRGRRVRFTASRLELSRYLALALEFQLAADILDTATSQNWTKIGQLAAIAAIRTALNYFLA